MKLLALYSAIALPGIPTSEWYLEFNPLSGFRTRDLWNNRCFTNLVKTALDYANLIPIRISYYFYKHFLPCFYRASVYASQWHTFSLFIFLYFFLTYFLGFGRIKRNPIETVIGKWPAPGSFILFLRLSSPTFCPKNVIMVTLFYRARNPRLFYINRCSLKEKMGIKKGKCPFWRILQGHLQDCFDRPPFRCLLLTVLRLDARSKAEAIAYNTFAFPSISRLTRFGTSVFEITTDGESSVANMLFPFLLSVDIITANRRCGRYS